MPNNPALDGIRVFEIGSSVAGPYGAWILAQFGAEVIKVERPDAGDDARHLGPPFWHGAAAYFQSLNRDKRGVTVDFKNTVLDEWLSFRFPPIGESKGKAYYFYLETSDDPQIDPMVLGKFSQDNYPEGRLMRNHQPQEGDLSFVALRE